MGKYRWSEWYVGEHTQRTSSRANIPMEWHVDDFWTHAYSNDYSEHKIKGSLQLLLQTVLCGKRVRVQIDSYVIDADNLNIRNGHVSAQLLGQLSKLNLYDFSTNVNWVWKIASTTGDVETMRYSIGSTENKGHSTDKSQSRDLYSQGLGLRCFLLRFRNWFRCTWI